MSRAEIGKVTLGQVSDDIMISASSHALMAAAECITCLQMSPELEAECVQEAQARAITLPSNWSVQDLVDKLREAMLDVNPAVLKMAASLRNHGEYAFKQLGG